MRRAGSLVLLACAALLGCAEDHFDYLYFSGQSDPPGEASLRPRDIVLQEGIAIRARVIAVDENGDSMPRLELQSGTRSVFVVDLGPRRGEWVFYGVSAGDAELDVFADGRYQASVPVEVIER